MPTHSAAATKDGSFLFPSIKAVDARGGANEVVIATNGEKHFVHTVSRPRKIVFHQTEEGADESLTILDCDSTETTLRFRTPASVLEVDGVNQ